MISTLRTSSHSTCPVITPWAMTRILDQVLPPSSLCFWQIMPSLTGLPPRRSRTAIEGAMRRAMMKSTAALILTPHDPWAINGVPLASTSVRR